MGHVTGDEARRSAQTLESSGQHVGELLEAQLDVDLVGREQGLEREAVDGRHEQRGQSGQPRAVW